MEIVQERLEREFGLDLITTAPTVAYRLHTKGGEILEIDNPARMPEAQEIDFIEEPVIIAMIHVPAGHVGKVLALCEDRRGRQKDFQAIGEHVILQYQLPLNEIVLDFHDRLKSVSRGYATFDYELGGFVRSDLVKLDVLINGDPVDALSCIVHKERAYYRGRELAARMREIIPRQMFEVAIQGGHRRARCRPRVGQGASQERDRQVLRRRRDAQAQAAGEAEGGQATDEAHGQRRHPAGRLPGHSQGGGLGRPCGERPASRARGRKRRRRRGGSGISSTGSPNGLMKRHRGKRTIAPPPLDGLARSPDASATEIKEARVRLSRATDRRLPLWFRASTLETVQAFLLATILMILIRALVVQSYIIPSGSMIPGLIPGDRVLALKLPYGVPVPFAEATLFAWKKPQVGEVYVFRPPGKTGATFIKRLVGGPVTASV